MGSLLSDWNVPPGIDDAGSGALRAWQAGSAVFFLVVLGAIFLLVDLSPQVDRALFFSTDDPQLREAEQIREIFPTPPQIIISARAGNGFDDAYVSTLAELSRDIQDIEGVVRVRDILHGPEEVEEAFERPMWRRLLVSEDGGATNLVVVLDTEDFDRVVTEVEEALDTHRSSEFQLAVSGEPYVVEQMRRQVVRDMLVFGLAALGVFTLAAALLYRSFWIVAGMALAGGTAAALTLLGRGVLGLQVDLLTPNLTTIVFVLTLLHVIFLTTNWMTAAAESGGKDAAGDGEGAGHEASEAEGAATAGQDGGLVRTAVAWTLPPSFWAMITTGLGFSSLLLAPAKPARNFGLSGALGALMALLCAYLIFPIFLRSADPGRKAMPWLDAKLVPFFRRKHGWAVLGVVAGALVAVWGVAQVETDPELFAYFGDRGGDDGSGVRSGLQRIDSAGGSSPLDLVFEDQGGGELGDDDAFERMWALQQDLESDSAVGSVLSLPVLMAEAEEEATLSFLLSWDFLLDRMEEPEHDRIARTFLTEDRRSGRFLMRMKESVRGEDESRSDVIQRLEEDVRNHGFEPTLTGGLYALQAKMTELVSSSLVTGLLGLTGLFTVIAFVVSRSLAVGVAMVLCFAMIPVFLLGVFGFFGIPLDVIALPAANMAMAIGVDDMVHLVFRVRREEEDGDYGWEAWVEGRTNLWRPIVNSSVVVTLGFGLLMLSGFPPTRRLGLAVVIGTLAGLAIVLMVFPRLALFLRDLKERV